MRQDSESIPMMVRIDRAVAAIRSRSSIQPEVGIILGSGLGAFADSVKLDTAIPYDEIPHAVASAVTGHAGRMVLGRVAEVPVVVLQGRIHYYEGHEMDEVIFLARVMARLGIRHAIVTNAAGGLNTSFSVGDLMLISDHINFFGVNPLRGPNLDALGVRFPDLSEAYPLRLRQQARRVAASQGVDLREGIYLGLPGPTYETPAEIRAFRILGADATGMSTVPEVLALAHMGVPVLGISCITNMAAGILPRKLTHDEVMETTAAVQSRFVALLEAIVPDLARG
jgi:purine-nucleoside phosphorylase